MFREHYDKLLTSVKDQCHKDCVYNVLKECDYVPDMRVTLSELQEIIQDLRCGKSAGCDGLSAEHLKYASNRLLVLLSMCLSAICVHGHVPQAMIDVNYSSTNCEKQDW
jgi:hypothetical protein